MYHGLRDDLTPVRRPLDHSEPEALLPVNLERYRHLIYGFSKAAAIVDGTMEDKTPAAVKLHQVPPSA